VLNLRQPMKYIKYGCECDFKFLFVQLVIHTYVIFSVSRLIYDGWAWTLVN
jgi:hypothetical protein